MPSLYVHVPFCVRKCSYCAFYSVPLAGDRVKAYLSALKQEIELRKLEALEKSQKKLERESQLESQVKSQIKSQIKSQAEFSTLFVGGGTPTALNESELDALLTLINTNYRFRTGAEKTVEANPGTLTTEKLKVLKKQGINRISLGVQSFNNALLKQISRIHEEAEVLASVKKLRQMGFANLNFDLIFGLPGQTLKDWKNSLEKAVSLRPEHISVYGLMVEEGTPLALRHDMEDVLPDDDLQADMYYLTREILESAGYRHYETSNFALPGYECQHNLGYWHGKEYLGLGPGAVSCLNNRRWKNAEDLNLYYEALMEGKFPITPEEEEELSEQGKRTERIILGLRLATGINLEEFAKEFGKKLNELYPEVLERQIRNEVLILEDGYLRLNPQYWFVANSVLQEFV